MRVYNMVIFTFSCSQKREYVGRLVPHQHPVELGFPDSNGCSDHPRVRAPHLVLRLLCLSQALFQEEEEVRPGLKKLVAIIFKNV